MVTPPPSRAAARLAAASAALSRAALSAAYDPLPATRLAALAAHLATRGDAFGDARRVAAAADAATASLESVLVLSPPRWLPALAEGGLPARAADDQRRKLETELEELVGEGGGGGKHGVAAPEAGAAAALAAALTSSDAASVHDRMLPLLTAVGRASLLRQLAAARAALPGAADAVRHPALADAWRSVASSGQDRVAWDELLAAVLQADGGESDGARLAASASTRSALATAVSGAHPSGVTAVELDDAVEASGSSAAAALAAVAAGLQAAPSPPLSAASALVRRALASHRTVLVTGPPGAGKWTAVTAAASAMLAEGTLGAVRFTDVRAAPATARGLSLALMHALGAHLLDGVSISPIARAGLRLERLGAGAGLVVRARAAQWRTLAPLLARLLAAAPGADAIVAISGELDAEPGDGVVSIAVESLSAPDAAALATAAAPRAVATDPAAATTLLNACLGSPALLCIAFSLADCGCDMRALTRALDRGGAPPTPLTLSPAARLLTELPLPRLLSLVKLSSTLGAASFTTAAAAAALGAAGVRAAARADLRALAALGVLDESGLDAWTLCALVADAATRVAAAAGLSTAAPDRCALAAAAAVATRAARVKAGGAPAAAARMMDRERALVLGAAAAASRLAVSAASADQAAAAAISAAAMLWEGDLPLVPLLGDLGHKTLCDAARLLADAAHDPASSARAAHARGAALAAAGSWIEAEPHFDGAASRAAPGDRARILTAAAVAAAKGRRNMAAAHDLYAAAAAAGGGDRDAAALEGAAGLLRSGGGGDAVAVARAALGACVEGGAAWATAANNLGVLLADLEPDEAASLHGRALAAREACLGPDHPAVAASLFNLALLRARQHRPADSLTMLRRALAIQEAALGDGHAAVSATRGAAAAAARALGRDAEAWGLAGAAVDSWSNRESVNAPSAARACEAACLLAALRAERGDGGGAKAAAELAARWAGEGAAPRVQLATGLAAVAFGDAAAAEAALTAALAAPATRADAAAALWLALPAAPASMVQDAVKIDTSCADDGAAACALSAAAMAARGDPSTVPDLDALALARVAKAPHATTATATAAACAWCALAAARRCAGDVEGASTAARAAVDAATAGPVRATPAAVDRALQALLDAVQGAAQGENCAPSRPAAPDLAAAA